jgi:sterol O-acyltransferase
MISKSHTSVLNGHLTPATSSQGRALSGLFGHGRNDSKSTSSIPGTPGSDTADKSRRYFLNADDDEIREILQARLEREAAAQHQKHFQNPRTRLRDLVFTKRFTHFDRQNPLNAESPFHGFFTLFWLSIFLLLARVAAQNWKVYGSVLGNAEILHVMFDRDVVVLGLTDLAMILFTLFGLGLQKLIQYDYLSWRKSGWIIQNIWQAMFLAGTIGWTFYRNWPWTHTVFIVLHCIVYLMKQHSYAFTNGYCKLGPLSIFNCT